MSLILLSYLAGSRSHCGMGFGWMSCRPQIDVLGTIPVPVFQGLVLLIIFFQYRLTYSNVVSSARRLWAVAQEWIVIFTRSSDLDRIRNSYLLRMKLVATSIWVFVGANQEVICNYVAEEFGNIPGSNAGDLGVISRRQCRNLVAICEGETCQSWWTV